MIIWAAELKEVEKLYESLVGQLPDLEKELSQLVKTDDPNVVMLYSRRCLEVIITDLCENELKRPRKAEPLKGIIDKLNSEEKVPSHIVASMHSLNSLATFGTHPKDFDPEQVKPVLNNLAVIIRWYLKYKDFKIISKDEPNEEQKRSIDYSNTYVNASKKRKRNLLLLSGLILCIIAFFSIFIINQNRTNQQISVKSRNTTTTFSVNSGFGDINDSIKFRFIRDGYSFTNESPQYSIEIISNPSGDPIAANGNADGFQYFYNSTAVQISINKQTPFGIGVTVPKTDPMPSYQQARDEYKRKFAETINNNIEEVYNQIKQNAPQK